MLKYYFNLLLYLSLLQHTKGSEEFLSFPNGTERSSEICCNDDDLLSCSEVKLDPRKLKDKEITLKGIQLTFSNNIEPNGFGFQNDQGDEAVLSYNKDTGNNNNLSSVVNFFTKNIVGSTRLSQNWMN